MRTDSHAGSMVPSGEHRSKDGSSQFKVFRRGEERRAFRLETIFWELLEQAAKSEGKALREFVFALTDASYDSSNRTSLLRAAAGHWAMTTIATGQARDSSLALGPFYASPAPGIIVAEDRRIVAYNKAMRDYIGRRGSAPPSEMANVRFVFELPIGQILRILEDSPRKFVECGFRLTIGREISAGRARIWPSASISATERHVGAFVL